MSLDISKINAAGKLTHMVAPDMFYNGCKQVFSAKTGKWLGTVQAYHEINFTEVEEPERMQEPEKENINQLSLF